MTTTDRPGLLGRFLARLTRHADDVQPGRIAVIRSTQAGVAVDAETALRSAVVWACIRYLTNAVAQLPWRVMREERDGDRIPAPTHLVDYLLHRRPCPEMGAFTWRQTMLGNALRYGNGYAEIERDNAGRPIALWPLHPLRVTVRRRIETGALYYEVQGDGVGQRVDLEPSEVFHIRGFGDGPVGYNVVEYAAQSIGWAQATELFGASFFGEGMNPSGVVQVKGGLSPDAFERMKAQFRKMYQGPKKSMRTAFLDNDATWTRIGIQPNEAQFIETMQHQVEEICRWFGVPPHKAMHLLRMTNNNIEHQSIEVVTDSVIPWVRILEDEADFKLFGQNRIGFFTQMDVAALLRGDMKAQAEYFGALTDRGIMNRNQARQRLGMNGIGPQGEIYTVQANMTTLERVGEAPHIDAPGPQSSAMDPPSPDEDPQSASVH